MSDAVETSSRIEPLLDVISPWHILIDAQGVIRRTGPSVPKLNDGMPLTGLQLLDFLELRRPKALSTMDRLMEQCGRKLHFVTRKAPYTELKGVIVPLPDGLTPGIENGAVLNLAFGISVIDAVRDYALAGNDFAVTDLTIELLYLVEANSAVTKELRHLNTRLESARVAAAEQAVTDTLTGLGNRRAMDQALEQLMERNSGFSIMNLDLDHFKEVNDTFGHAAGDAVLLHVADRLRGVTRSEDVVIRQGGDEFMLVLPGMTDFVNVSNLAERLVKEIEAPVSFGTEKLRVSASIGIRIATDLTCTDPDAMMKEADIALYMVKEQGRHGFRIYGSEMGEVECGGSAA